MYSLEMYVLNDTFSLQSQLISHTIPQSHVAYALQKPLKIELEWLQQLSIILPLQMDEAAEWYNNFVLAPMCNGEVRLCLDPARLDQAML